MRESWRPRARPPPAGAGMARAPVPASSHERDRNGRAMLCHVAFLVCLGSAAANDFTPPLQLHTCEPPGATSLRPLHSLTPLTEHGGPLATCSRACPPDPEPVVARSQARQARTRSSSSWPRTGRSSPLQRAASATASRSRATARARATRSSPSTAARRVAKPQHRARSLQRSPSSGARAAARLGPSPATTTTFPGPKAHIPTC